MVRPASSSFKDAIDAPLRSGDIVFVRGPGFVQRLVDWSGDHWRHVGILVSLRGHWWVLEAGRAGYRASPLTTILNRYSHVSLSRLDPCRHDCANRLVDAALLAMDVPTKYPSRLELAIAGLLSLSRKSSRMNNSALGVMAYWSADRYRTQRSGSSTRTMCSSLVVRSFAHLCGRHNHFPDLSEAKDKATRTDRDHLADRFALPDDIWRLLGHSRLSANSTVTADRPNSSPPPSAQQPQP